MTQRPSRYDIPSDFIPLDTNVSAEDSFVNVADMRTMRENHNILLVQRLRRQLFSYCAIPVTRPMMSARPLTHTNPDLFMVFPVRISSNYVQELTVWINATRNATTGNDMDIYPVAMAGGGPQPPLDKVITVDNSAGDGWYSVDIPISPQIAMNRIAQIRIYLDGGTTGVNQSTGIVISDAGPDFVDLVTPYTTTADLSCVVINDEVRKIADRKVVSGTVERLLVTEPWNVPITPGVDTADTILGKAFVPQAVCVYEKTSSDFDTPDTVI